MEKYKDYKINKLENLYIGEVDASIVNELQVQDVVGRYQALMSDLFNKYRSTNVTKEDIDFINQVGVSYRRELLNSITPYINGLSNSKEVYDEAYNIVMTLKGINEVLSFLRSKKRELIRKNRTIELNNLTSKHLDGEKDFNSVFPEVNQAFTSARTSLEKLFNGLNTSNSNPNNNERTVVTSDVKTSIDIILISLKHDLIAFTSSNSIFQASTLEDAYVLFINIIKKEENIAKIYNKFIALEMRALLESKTIKDELYKRMLVTIKSYITTKQKESEVAFVKDKKYTLKKDRIAEEISQ